MNKFMLSFMFCCAGMSVTAMEPGCTGQRRGVDSRVFAVDPHDTLSQLLRLKVVQVWRPTQQGIGQAAYGTEQGTGKALLLFDVRGQRGSSNTAPSYGAGVVLVPTSLIVARVIGASNE